MADPVAASDTAVDNADVAYLFTQTSTNAFRKTNTPPDALGFVSKTGAQTLTNKSLSDSTTYIVDEADATKKLQFQVSSITTGTTRVLTAPNHDGTIATLAGTETLTNKSLSDSTTSVVDNSDATKKFQFQASGITTATTRTYTAPDKDGTLAMLSDVALDHLVTTNTSVAAAAIDFTTSVFSGDYDFFVFKIRKLFEASSGTSLLTLRVSDNSGSSYISSNYAYMFQGVEDDDPAVNVAGTAQLSVLLMVAPFGQGTPDTSIYPGVTGEIVLYSRPTSGASASDSNNECSLMWELYQYRNGVQHMVKGGARVPTSGRVNGLRLLPVSGGTQMHGVIEVYGGRNS